jgi:hypothetical protein
MKEIEYAIVDTLKPNTQLIDSIAQIVGFRTAQLMSLVSQALYSDPTLVLRFGGETVQPIEHGNGMGILLIKDNRSLGHDRFLGRSHYCEQRSRCQ